MRCVIDEDNIQDLLKGFPIEFKINGEYILFSIDSEVIKNLELYIQNTK